MMDFNLTEERRMLQDTLRRFLSDTYDHERRNKVIVSGAAYDTDTFQSLAELGVLGALFPEAQGGFGGAGFDLATVFEELGRAGTIEPVLATLLAGRVVSDLAGDSQADLISTIIDGTTVVALAHSEPQSRYDLERVATVATSDGAEVILSGTKTHVINGAQAQILVVTAREHGEHTDVEGISAFCVPIDAKGVTVVDHINVDGTSAATVVLDDVRVPSQARLGAAGAAYEVIELAIARATLAVCAEALGAMESAKALTIDYLKERKQFGIAIGKFQALQHRMADMLIEVEQARSAVVNLAGHIEAPRNERERHVSAAKNLIGRVGAIVAEECIQMHGGIGMTNEYALSHFARRITMIDHQFGDVDHHLERFIALSVQ